jgi:hypothetical protein
MISDMAQLRDRGVRVQPICFSTNGLVAGSASLRSNTPFIVRAVRRGFHAASLGISTQQKKTAEPAAKKLIVLSSLLPQARCTIPPSKRATTDSK